jgi:hypothetical protein
VRPGKPGILRSLKEIDMNNVIKHFERPRKNIAWQALPQPAQCVHHFEVIAHQEAGVLRRCFRCGSLEVE